MSVGMVTARSHGGVLARRKMLRTFIRGIPAPVQTASIRAANSRLVALLIGRASPLPVAVIIGAWMYYNRKVAPEGFPGFDDITAGWRVPVVGPDFAPGDYVPNPFDHGAFNNPPESLLDTDDIQFPTGIRYWGDFDVEPYPDARPGLNWPTVPAFAPAEAPLPMARPGAIAPPIVVPPFSGGGRLRYNVPLTFDGRDLIIDEALVNNVSITIGIPGRSSEAGSIAIRTNFPRKRPGPQRKKKRTREKKAKPKSALGFFILKRIANIGGEIKEWIDILAAATDYDGFSIRYAAGFRPFTGGDPGSGTAGGDFPEWIDDGGHETLRKAWYLFEMGAFNHLDEEHLAVLIIENEIEDAIFGAIGQLSKSAGRNLGLTFGPQTGLAI